MNNSYLPRLPQEASEAGNPALAFSSISSAPGLRPLALALCLVGQELAFAAAGPGREIPVAKFTDITQKAGIGFTHINGAYGDKLLPETMGGGWLFLILTTMASRTCCLSTHAIGRSEER